MRRIRSGKKKKKKFRLYLNDFGFICARVSSVVSYKRNACYNLSCELQIYCRLSFIAKLFLHDSFFESVNCGNGWRKDVVNQCLEFGSEYSCYTCLLQLLSGNSLLSLVLSSRSIQFHFLFHLPNVPSTFLRWV